MPVYKDLTIDDHSRVLIWRVEESEEELIRNMHFCQHSLERLKGMKSGVHRRAFASIRYLFRELGYDDNDVVYNGYGKPQPRDGSYISITHSGMYTGLIHSTVRPVGIDIELKRDKILRIANKFTRFHHGMVPGGDAEDFEQRQVRTLTAIWAVKESIYKLYGKKGLSFLDHITAEEVVFENGMARASVNFGNRRREFGARVLEFDGYTCVWVLEPEKE